MIPEIGHFSLVLALILALMCGVFPLLGAKLVGTRNVLFWAHSAKSLVLGQFVFVSLSFIALTLSFLQNDFSVKYVANQSNSLLPIQYKISAVWGGHEGSLLLWIWILCLWMLGVAFTQKTLPTLLRSKVLAIMSLIAVGFIWFILATSNPFDRLLPEYPMDGNDLNPLLQDIGLIFHPPLLYLGYVGFSVPFAFAIAALLSGYYDKDWAAWSSSWAKLAWAFLTIGIALGSWWAYYELGWGGWWFWDPVENASFMPWLAGVALIHSLAVCEKQGTFKIWTILIAIITFSLSLLGTFLVRSGVLTSVHAFASDPDRGLFILIFLCVVVGGALLLFSIRADRLKSTKEFKFVSKEFLLILNNVLLLVACATVLIGTLFPIFSDALDWGKISVGPPYFNTLFFPLCLISLFLMAFAPVIKWRGHDFNEIVPHAIKLGLVSVVLATALHFLLFHSFQWKSLVTLVLCFWVSAFLIFDLNSKQSGYFNFFKSWQKLSLGQKNMHIAHFGLLVSIVGVAFTSMFSVERDLSLGVGETVDIGGYEFTFNGVREERGPNYDTIIGEVNVSRNGDFISSLTPEKRQYLVQKSPMTEAAIDPSLTRDLYVALGEPLGKNRWSLRVYYKPYIRLIWLGSLIMAGSCILAVARKRLSPTLAHS